MPYETLQGGKMYGKLLNKMVFPLINQMYPGQKNIFKYHQFLNKSQWWKPEELQQYQKKKLKHLLEHAYTNVPYYHKIFKESHIKPEDIKELKDLQKLPYLTKDYVITNFDQLIPRNINTTKVIPSFTGGTTGKRMKFFVDDEWESWNMAAAYREWGWAGYHIGDKMVYLWGSLDDVKIQNQIRLKLFNMIQRIQILNAYDMNQTTFPQYIKTLQRFKPKIINAYASAAHIMAKYLTEHEIQSIHPNAVLTSCETLFDFQKKSIEEAFHCPVFDYYSARDTSLHAAECDQHIGYHTAIENAIVEFTKNDVPVSNGEIGEITITDLSNFSMPFIRYKIGDMGIPSDETCPCGRTLPLIKKVIGRVSDMIVTKDGKYIPGLFFIHIFDTDAIRKYQLIQKNKERFILKIVKTEHFSQQVIDTILTKIKEKCGDVDIQVEDVEEIPLTSSGKYRFIISEINNHY